jgi:translocation and assembly module TamA
MRWKSPVGPVQADLAYGVKKRKLRLHMSVGFVF